MRRSLFVTVVLMSSFALSKDADAASFDCAKAKSAMEKTICADSSLSALDERLAKSYRQALKAPGAKNALTEMQRDWLRSLEFECGDAECYRRTFAARVQLLERVARKGKATSWNGNYVRYRNGREDSDSARLAIVALDDGRFMVAGGAVWLGPNAASGQVNTGEIDGIARSRNMKVVYDEDGCTAEFALNAQGLSIGRETGCGGLNVTFVGDYRRR